MTQPDPLLGRVLGGRYRLLRPLGQGGSGAVYEAEQLGLGRKVAVKLMRPELSADAEHLERFRREALAAAQLGHPHIVQLFDFADARDSEPSYLVLELVEGRSLFQLLRAESPIAPARAVMLARQILAALQTAHRAGIVHRDLKPGNVMVAEMTGLGEVAKVLDFGIARIQESPAYQRLTRTGIIVGTPRYMSPEQASGGVIDGRSDLWSLGVILYVALTGRFPFDGTPSEIVIALMTARVPPMSTSGVPRALEAVVTRALEKRPDDRYATAEAMSEALLGALTSESAAVSPPVSTLSQPSDVRALAGSPMPQPLIPRWLRWALGLFAAGGLGLVALVAVALLIWRPWSPSPGPGPIFGDAAPVLGGSRAVTETGDAPTSGTSSVFLEDALRRAAARDPGARLAMVSGTQLSASGSGDASTRATWAFYFIDSRDDRFQVGYYPGAAAYPLVNEIERRMVVGPLDTEPADSAEVLAAVVVACPAFAGREDLIFSVTPQVGLAVATLHGPTWTGNRRPDGAIVTTFAAGCR